MEELYNRLVAVSDSYFGFVAGVTTYAKRKPERVKAVLDYMNNNQNATSSDILQFVVTQPDFHDDGLLYKEKVS